MGSQFDFGFEWPFTWSRQTLPLATEKHFFSRWHKLLGSGELPLQLPELVKQRKNLSSSLHPALRQELCPGVISPAHQATQPLPRLLKGIVTLLAHL